MNKLGDGGLWTYKLGFQRGKIFRTNQNNFGFIWIMLEEITGLPVFGGNQTVVDGRQITEVVRFGGKINPSIIGITVTYYEYE